MTTERNIAIVCNPLAGVGRAVDLADKISTELSGRGIGFFLFKKSWPTNFDGYTDVFIVGGDGTLNFFVNLYPNVNLPLVIFNGGTGNDVHWLLYGNKNFQEQLDLALNGEAKPIDAGRCNDKFFMNGVGIGFEGAVAKSLTGKKKKAGKASFMTAVLKKIFSYTSKRYRISSEECNQENRNLLISIMNGQRAGGGFHIAPTSLINDGLLDVVLVEKLNPLQRLFWLPVIEGGKHLHLSFIKHFGTKKIIISSDTSIQAHLDGEYYESKRLEIEILPQKFLFRY